MQRRNDSYNWNNVLNNAVKQNPNLSFVASAGDQVNNNNNEKQYAGYLGADALRSLPVATTIGNHDSGSAQYEMHYNNPNAFDTSGYRNTAKYTEGKTAKRNRLLLHIWKYIIYRIRHKQLQLCNSRKCYA